MIKLIHYKICTDKTRRGKAKFKQYASDEFEVEIGLRQRDLQCLFNVLFNIALETIIGKTRKLTFKCGSLVRADNDIFILGFDSKTIGIED